MLRRRPPHITTPTITIAGERAESPLSRQLVRYSGAAVALVGLLAIAGWYAHWRVVVQVIPSGAPMQYNTALCMVLCGAGLFLLTTGRRAATLWFGAAVLILPLGALTEYVCGLDLGMDQMFLKPFFEVQTAYPGRMSPLAAVCFILVGTGILLLGGAGKWRHVAVATGILACVTGVIALLALCGYAFGMSAAYNWGSYSSMAVNTSVLFSLLAAGLLCSSWQKAPGQRLGFLRWLPITAAVTLMVMIAFVSGVNMVEVGKATFWRKHALQVILGAQAFEENLNDLQRSARGYVTVGDAASLRAYQADLALEPQQFNGLVELTSDNPSQQRRLRDVGAAMEVVLAYDRRIVDLYGRQGATAAIKRDDPVQRRTIGANARAAVAAFSQEEERLLAEHGAAEETGAANASRLFTFSSGLAALFLVTANYFVGREIGRRRRVEMEREKLIAELQELLDKVKTLSGMIPICGWCKSIRSDQGYWQTVENYVREHTEATFTHGICPSCAEKFKADLLETDTPAPR